VVEAVDDDGNGFSRRGFDRAFMLEHAQLLSISIANLLIDSGLVPVTDYQAS